MTHPTLPARKDTVRMGFTLIELLVVISIIGLLASVVLASVNSARAKGRDAKRLAEMNTLRNALELYYDDYGDYPSVAASGDGSLAGWKVSFLPNFLAPLVPKYVSSMPADPTNIGPNTGPPDYMFNPRPDGSFFYMYYRYDAGSYGCPTSGPFAIIGFRSIEGTDKSKLPKAQCGPQNPPCLLGGTSTCRDWSTEFDYSVLVVP